MTVEDLKRLATRKPFEPFTVHMNDGFRLKVAQPDDIFLHRNWPFNALIMLDRGVGPWRLVDHLRAKHRSCCYAREVAQDGRAQTA
jgi:hypothetical protein